MHLDKRAIKLFLRKDEAASCYIYAKTSRLVKHMAFEVLHDASLAEDAMMDTYLAVIQAGGEFHDAKAFISYLCITAKNIALNMAKKGDRVSLEENEEVFVDEANSPERSQLLIDAKRILKEEDYELVTLHLCLDLSFPMISSIQGGTASSCRGRYFRALKTLRSKLKEEDYR